MSPDVTPTDLPGKVSGSTSALRPAVPVPVGALRALVSAFIFVVLLCQLVIGFTYHGGHAYPFVSYPMFSRAHFDGERLNDYLVYVSADGGAEEAYDRERMQLAWPTYQGVMAIPVIAGEKREATKALAATSCERGAKMVTVKVYDSGYSISREGPSDVGKKLMGSVEYVCSEM